MMENTSIWIYYVQLQAKLLKLSHSHHWGTNKTLCLSFSTSTLGPQKKSRHHHHHQKHHPLPSSPPLPTSQHFSSRSWNVPRAFSTDWRASSRLSPQKNWILKNLERLKKVQNSPQQINMSGFQRVQNPDPNKLHNASKSCSRQKKQ